MTTYTAEDAHAAVALGAQWLDRECPHWASKIDLAELDMTNTNVCILGQTAECIVGPVTNPNDIYADAGFWRVVRAKAISNQDEWTLELGFDVPDPSDVSRYSDRWDRELDTRYEMLTICWADLIRERLAAGVPQ